MDYDVNKLEKVRLDDLIFAEWNPKSDVGDYQKVKHSIEVNGILSPLFVRETDEGLELVDGHQRASAMKELGYEEAYVYNLGRISEAEAKRLALWMAVQVPFDEVMLAPLVVELNGYGMELPFDNKELEKFESMEAFDMNFGEEEPVEENLDLKLKTFRVRLTPEQFDRVKERVDFVCREENVSEGRSVELLIAEAMS